MTDETNDTSLKRARKRYGQKKDREIIGRRHGVDPDHPALWELLAFCVQYNLDPLGGHVWLIDENFDSAAAKDGEPAGDDVDLRVGITRDGLLFIAHGDPSYEGMDHDVVCAKDAFKVTREGDAHTISHSYPDLPDATEDGEKLADYRGEVVGAYCKVYVRGKKPTYYFAFLKEHGQFDDEGNPRGAWKYVCAMSIKAAQSVSLRLALGVTGVVGLDEIKRGERRESQAAAAAEGKPEDFIAGLDLPEGIRDELATKITAANEKDPNSWSLAKVQMRLGVTDPDVLLEAADRTLSELDGDPAAPTPVAASS